jgi:hypothetical protein
MVYENGVLEVGAVKNGDRVYCMGESTLEMARGPEDPLALIFLIESARCSKGGCSFLAKSYQGTSGSPRFDSPMRRVQNFIEHSPKLSMIRKFSQQIR